MASPSGGELHDFLIQNSFDSTLEDIQSHIFFPSDEMLSLYLENIRQYTDLEVIDLLWKMLSATTSRSDAIVFPLILEAAANPPEGISGDDITGGGWIRRMRWREKTGIGDAWEGITWALEMLPFKPGLAVRALDLYLEAQHGLPDDRIHAISDVIDIIRARWIGIPESASDRLHVLSEIDPRTFEALVGELWVHMGYRVTLTPRTADGGYDLRAVQNLPGRHQDILIECKRHSKPIGVQIVRELGGALQPDRTATTCVVVTNSRFTKPAIDYTSNTAAMDLVDGKRLVILFNEHLGYDWPLRIGRITAFLLTKGEDSLP
jgi:restriction system protein